jgi:hypothetical protein
LPSKSFSRPLSWPQIFTAIRLLKTATFEESGRDGGHLATLFVTAKNEAKRKFLKGNQQNFFLFSLRSEKFEAKRSENKRKNWSLIFA